MDEGVQIVSDNTKYDQNYTFFKCKCIKVMLTNNSFMLYCMVRSRLNTVITILNKKKYDPPGWEMKISPDRTEMVKI